MNNLEMDDYPQMSNSRSNVNFNDPNSNSMNMIKTDSNPQFLRNRLEILDERTVDSRSHISKNPNELDTSLTTDNDEIESFSDLPLQRNVNELVSSRFPKSIMKKTSHVSNLSSKLKSKTFRSNDYSKSITGKYDRSSFDNRSSVSKRMKSQSAYQTFYSYMKIATFNKLGNLDLGIESSKKIKEYEIEIATSFEYLKSLLKKQHIKLSL